MAKSPVERRRDALVPGRCDDHDSRVPSRPGAEDLRRPIGRSVIDDEELEVGEVLRNDALNGLIHKPFTVKDRHEHSDTRGAWHGRRLSACGGSQAAPSTYSSDAACHSCAMFRMIKAQSKTTLPDGNFVSSEKKLE
jgi:hypothetical protein